MNTFTSESLEAFKKRNNVSSISVKISKKTGKFYATMPGNGPFIGMVADDYKSTKDNLSVLHCTDQDTGETWDFICALQPTPEVDTI